MEIFVVPITTTSGPMGPARTPDTVINGSSGLNVSLTANDTVNNLASNDSAGGGALAGGDGELAGDPDEVPGRAGSNDTADSYTDNVPPGNDTEVGSTYAFIDIPMVTDVSGVLIYGEAKFTSNIPSRLGCRVIGGNPAPIETEIFIGDDETPPTTITATFTWDTTTPGFRFPRFFYEAIVDVTFQWIDDEKIFICHARTGSVRPDLRRNDSVLLDIKGNHPIRTACRKVDHFR